MTTLVDYAQAHYPNHSMETDGDVTLTSHTAVAHVIGETDTVKMKALMQEQLPGTPVGVVWVKPTPPSVVPNGGEDPEGVADLPRRRLAVAGVSVGAVVGVLVGIVAGLISDSAWTGVIVGVFAAVLGAASGAMISGGGRFGGDRAWQQSNNPTETVGLVAAFLDEERLANNAVQVMETLHPHDVRILSERGAWHSPSA